MVAQAAAVAALDDVDHLQRIIDRNREGMEQLVSVFQRLGLPYIESAGNFVAVNTGHGLECYEALLQKGIIVRPVSNYGMPDHLRVTVGRADENARLLHALGQVLA